MPKYPILTSFIFNTYPSNYTTTARLQAQSLMLQGALYSSLSQSGTTYTVIKVNGIDRLYSL